MRFRPGDQGEPVLRCEAPFWSWDEPAAQTGHRGWSKFFVVLFGLSHFVQLKQHHTSADTLRFEFYFDNKILAWRGGPCPEVING